MHPLTVELATELIPTLIIGVVDKPSPISRKVIHNITSPLLESTFRLLNAQCGNDDEEDPKLGSKVWPQPDHSIWY